MEKIILDRLRDSGTSVAEVCRDAGISRPTFYAVLRDGPEPKLHTIRALADIFGSAVSEMLSPAGRVTALETYIARREKHLSA